MRKTIFLPILAIALLLAACAGRDESADRKESAMVSPGQVTEKATLAGGCFWCMEHPFDEIDGVIDVTSGYSGGEVVDPTYEQVCRGDTGHLEAVDITYDPSRTSFEALLEVFWRQINPTDAGGAFADRGPQYRSAIFYRNETQRAAAEASKAALAASGRFDQPIATEILPYSEFYKAEEYHQDYYKKQPMRYERYRAGSGRAAYIDAVWGDADDAAH